MIQEVQTLASLYDVNSVLVRRAFRGLSKTQVTFRPLEVGNSMHWVLGHLVNSRHTICNHLGAGLVSPFGKRFSRGSKIQKTGESPSTEALLQSWKSISEELQRQFERATLQQLDQSITAGFPAVEKTVWGAVSFLHLHESYHVGQLAYIRVLLGESQLVG